jgi:hypothetical protein
LSIEPKQGYYPKRGDYVALRLNVKDLKQLRCLTALVARFEEYPRVARLNNRGDVEVKFYSPLAKKLLREWCDK